MTQVSDLLPSIGFAGHLSQMQEKMCVLNLNCHRYYNYHKVVVDIYARFGLSIKHICKDIHSSIEKYEESQSAILFLL